MNQAAILYLGRPIRRRESCCRSEETVGLLVLHAGYTRDQTMYAATMQQD